MTQVINTPQGIANYQFLARRSALKLEILGMKRRGQSAYSICKQAYGLKGSKQSVYDQMTQALENVKADAASQKIVVD